MKTKLSMILSLTLVIQVYAGSATWNLNPISNDWNNPANWTPNTVPNGPADVATFATSRVTEIAISADTTVDSIVYNTGASAFTVTATPKFALTLAGAGIANNSGSAQNLVAATDDNGGGEIVFTGSATAAGATITVNGATVEGFIFQGFLIFADNATAGNATIILNAGLVPHSAGGQCGFEDLGDGGTARFICNGGLDVGGGAPVTIGSLEGSGAILIGGRIGGGFGSELRVGSNNLSTRFSGSITFFGPFTKIGTGTLTLTGTGPGARAVNVNEGTLIVNTSEESGLGHGEVMVDGGTLGGNGIIATCPSFCHGIVGPVTVGSRSGAESFLAPAAGTSRKATLSMESSLTFKSGGTYTYTFQGSGGNIESDKVVANGVTIDIGKVNLVGKTQGALEIGLVLTLISNTSANPISGTFSNLGDGEIVTVNGNNFQASYTGGDGNDLTLTVVP
jgi:hypothetical protein